MSSEYDSVATLEPASVELASSRKLLNKQKSSELIKTALTPGATLNREASRHVIRFVTGADEENDPELKKFMMSLDADGDGEIDEKKLHQLMKRFYESEHFAAMLKKILTGLFVLCCVLLICLSVMTWRVVEVSKETKVQNDVMTSKKTGNVAQCASHDTVVQNGVLTVRDSDSSRRKLMELDVNGRQIMDALATRQHSQEVTLSSTLPDKYFEELMWLKIYTSTGLSVSLKIQGLSRLLTRKAKCGTLLQIVTTAGVLVLDDTDIYYDTDLFGIFSSAGFDPVTTTETMSIVGRRLQSSSTTFSISGFFNAISTYDWKCETVKKPSLPDSFVMSADVLTLCANSACSFAAYPSSKDVSFIQQYGVVALKGDNYIKTQRQYVVSSDGSYSHTVDSPLYRPGVKSVSISKSAGERVQFQTEADGTYSHCMHFESVESASLNLPSDYFFYPIDDASVSSNLMHFRISYRSNPTELDLQFGPVPEWVHIDYFEDKTTKIPQILVSGQGDIIQVTKFAGYDPKAQLTVDAKKFDECLVVSHFVEDASFPELQSIMVDPSQKNSLDWGSEMKLIADYWDWRKPYPPKDNGPATFSYKDFAYYFAQGSVVSLPADWVDWANKNRVAASFDPSVSALPVVAAKTRQLESKSAQSINSLSKHTWYVTNNDVAQDVKVGAVAKTGRAAGASGSRRRLAVNVHAFTRKLATSNKSTWKKPASVVLMSDDTAPKIAVIGGNSNWNMSINLLSSGFANITAFGDGSCAGSVCLIGKMSSSIDLSANPKSSKLKSLFSKGNFGNDVTIASGSLVASVKLAELYALFRTNSGTNVPAVFGDVVSLGFVDYTVKRGKIDPTPVLYAPYIYKQLLPDVHKIGRVFPLSLGPDDETSLIVQGSFQFEMQVPNDKVSYLCSDDNAYLQDCATYSGSVANTYRAPIKQASTFTGFAKSTFTLQYKSAVDGMFSNWVTVSDGIIFDMALDVIEQGSPTSSPTIAPTAPTAAPTKATPKPSNPTAKPSVGPTSKNPTFNPSRRPTTLIPSARPTPKPSVLPSSTFPTEIPTSKRPTKSPTAQPVSSFPTELSTKKPVSRAPIAVVGSNTKKPIQPTLYPSTHFPTEKPTGKPSTKPRSKPTCEPSTAYPTEKKSVRPSKIPPTFYPSTSFPTDKI